MFNRKVRIRLPIIIIPRDMQDLQEARDKDQQERLERKEKRDKRTTAREKMVKAEDKVLVLQRKSTTKPPFNPDL